MKRELYKKISCLRQIGVVNPDYEKEPDEVKDTSELANILSEIFAVNPLTGLPEGDLAYYMSPNGNPSVREWLANNLLKPRFGERFAKEGLTDDMIAEYARMPSESTLDYASRMRLYYDEASKLLQSEKVDKPD